MFDECDFPYQNLASLLKKSVLKWSRIESQRLHGYALQLHFQGIDFDPLKNLQLPYFEAVLIRAKTIGGEIGLVI